jgi:hypothetical protein
MNDFLVRGHNFEHLLAGLILLGRVGDVGSTYLITPTLLLETNPVMRRLRWPAAVLSLALCLVPYYNTALAVTLLALTLLVSANSLSRGWVARAVGEEAFLAFLESAARRTSRRVAVAFSVGASLFLILAGAILMALSGGQEQWAFWFALGIVLYGIAIGMYGSLFTLRLFRRLEPNVRVMEVA